MDDDTLPYHQQRFIEINSDPGDRRTLETKYGQVWNADELNQDFEVIGSITPIVVVRRRSDGQRGSLEIQNDPRFYFNFEPHEG